MGWERYAKVGDKVECIRSEIGAPDGVEILEQVELPEVGKVYTVAGIWRGEVVREPGLLLAEIGEQRVDFRLNGEEFSGIILYDPKDFRPLQSRPTDISSLTALLNTAPADELEEA